jgi:hypothetical protein
MQTYQTVLTMNTRSDNLRSEAIGWSIESGKVARMAMLRHELTEIAVGLIGQTHDKYTFPTVLHALGHGYKLLSAPPTRIECNGRFEWEWWLVKYEEFSLGLPPRPKRKCQ